MTNGIVQMMETPIILEVILHGYRGNGCAAHEPAVLVRAALTRRIFLQDGILYRPACKSVLGVGAAVVTAIAASPVSPAAKRCLLEPLCRAAANKHGGECKQAGEVHQPAP